MAEILEAGRQMQSLFEQPEHYDAMLEKGIGITGNDKFYFIRGRIDLVRGKLKNKPRRILDFGCGIGDSSYFMSDLFPEAEIVGSDVAEAAIAFAVKKHVKPNLKFLVSSQLPKESRFDLIYLNCVFHHITPSERQETADLLFSLMSPGGIIWVFENNPANPGTQLAMYTNPFDKDVVKVWPKEQRNLLKTSGFNLIETEFLFYFPQWLSVFRPLEKLLNKVPMGGQYGVCAQKSI